MKSFSNIADQFDVPTNRLYRLRADRLKKGRPLMDLVSGNVNTQGIVFPPGILERAMRTGLRAARSYRPDPLGQPVARQAIARYYAKEGLSIPPQQILLTPGTSLSYWYAFKLLADPGEEFLCPTPSYPLFDSIAGLSGVKLTPYRLKEETTRWNIDFEHLESLVTPKTKGIILISPHNPTGAVASEQEIAQLAAVAQAKKLAIISDEVFSPFLFGPKRLPRPAASRAPLVLTLNGLSKMLALPGMKIGWMAISGDPALVRKSITTLEMISDTFLPVNEPAQMALPHILKASGPFQKAFAAEIRQRQEVATEIVRGSKTLSFIEPEGGFFLTLRLNAEGADEEEIAYRLLEKHGILVHPGYFYDMEGQHLVLSFVSRPSLLRKTLNTLVAES